MNDCRTMCHIFVNVKLNQIKSGSLYKMSRGVNENIQLKSKLETQLSRLLDQLEDLENNKDSIDDEEYAELKNETLEQVIMRFSRTTN